MEGFEAMLGRIGGKGLFKVGEEEAFKDFSSRTKERERAVGGGEVKVVVAAEFTDNFSGKGVGSVTGN